MLDTANLEAIKRYMKTFPVAGVTTNPTIIKNEEATNFFDRLNKIRELIGPDRKLHAQVVARDTDGIIKDALSILNNVDKDVYIKVPVTEDGMKAIQMLKEKGIHVTATTIHSKFQAYLAIASGADYVVPYFNRMEILDIDSQKSIQQISQLIQKNHYQSKILVASFKSIYQVNAAFESGAEAATLPISILEQGFNTLRTNDAVDVFTQNWESLFGKGVTISDLDKKNELA